MAAPLSTAVQMMAGYNLWANGEFIQYFKTQDADLLETGVASSFPSIQKTLMHIWDAQDIWYQRLKGRRPSQFLSSTWQGTFEELCHGLMQSSLDHVDLVKAYNAETLEEALDYHTMSYGPQKSRRFEILLHVFNHSMYHRGQCVTMARSLGMSRIPGTDLIRYLRIH
jgi:uncharacterized damage-inducible protein DinB